MKRIWIGVGLLFTGGLMVMGASGRAQSGTVNFDLKANITVGGAPLELGKLYKTPAGTEYQVDLVRFYTSNVQLVKNDGSNLTLPGVSLTSWMAGSAAPTAQAGQLMDGGQLYNPATSSGATFFKFKAPAGDYKGVRFEVGVPKDLNHRDASTVALPLGLESGMFWAWNPGYIFFRLEGKTMVDGKAQPWLLHMGTDNWRMSVNLFDLTSNKVKVAVTEGGSYGVNLDLAKLFEKGPNGQASWDLSNPAQRVMHGGPFMGQAYLNLLNAWSAGQ
jgi:hypothetical protein